MTETERVRVDLSARSYDIEITTDALARSGDFVRESIGPGYREGQLAFIVTDSNVRAHADAVGSSMTDSGWRTAMSVVPAGEPSKSLATAETVFGDLAAAKADRTTIVVAVGGGVVGDLAGFVAATWGRGVPFVQVPTTLLADVDSSVGGKTGVNIAAGKNLVGSFHQPRGVFIDTATLSSLPDREFRAGLAEVVKYGVILDADFFDYLEKHVGELNGRDPAVLRQIIARSCRLKADVVENDEEERTGLRAVLNYGHTFGHAYETLLGYGTMLHGEAVAVGMEHAARLALAAGMVDRDFCERQHDLLSALALPTQLPTSLDAEAVIDRMRVDKKSLDGRMRFILPERMGSVRLVEDLDESLVRSVLEDILAA